MASGPSAAVISSAVSTSAEMLSFVEQAGLAKVHVVGIDEAQFFDDGLIDAVERLANEGVRVICAARSRRSRPFPK